MDLGERRIIEKEIEERRKAVIDLQDERRQVYLSVQDFATADAVTTDKAIERMKRIDILIKSQKKEIETRRIKLNLKDR